MAFVEDCLRRGFPGDNMLRDARVAAEVAIDFYCLTLEDLS